MPKTPPATRAPSAPLSAPQKALHKLGLVRDIDLALHLPLRYEDATRIVNAVGEFAFDGVALSVSFATLPTIR